MPEGLPVEVAGMRLLRREAQKSQSFDHFFNSKSGDGFPSAGLDNKRETTDKGNEHQNQSDRHKVKCQPAGRENFQYQFSDDFSASTFSKYAKPSRKRTEPKLPRPLTFASTPRIKLEQSAESSSFIRADSCSSLSAGSSDDDSSPVSSPYSDTSITFLTGNSTQNNRNDIRAGKLRSHHFDDNE
eukprot:Platyproteum_vivax@DN13036_c0_g1_i1.p2